MPGYRGSLDSFLCSNFSVLPLRVVAMVFRLFCRVLSLAALGGALIGAPAHAGLGRPLSAVAQDGTPVVQAQRQAAQAASAAGAAAATVRSQTIETPQGATVTEYADAAGTVFAITWKGPFKPDLQQLLGDYFGPYLQAARAQPQQLNQSRVHGADIVVHSAGRMRAFVGVAWVPSLVPAGFDPSTLQP